MESVTIYQDHYADTTVVPNRFLDEYMQEANDAQLKIYLYLIRTMGAHLPTSIPEMADRFNYTEKDVLRALKYWEKKKLLDLEFDADKNLTGIHLQDLGAAKAKSSSEQIVQISTRLQPMQEQAPADPYAKPSYTLDELQAFKADETAARILFVTEQYLKKTLSANEMKTILYISGTLGFSEDLIDYLVQYCVERGKKDLRYIEKVAVNWAQEGITTPKQAARYVHKYDKTVYEVMQALGKTAAPTQAEADFVKKWTKDYALSKDLILAACEKTVLATDNHRFEYADSILTSWHKAGITNREEIAALDTTFKRKAAAKSAGQDKNKFNQFTQNQYDYTELEKELLSN